MAAEAVKSRAAAHDLELVAVAATGGREAFGELVRRHSSAVRALLRRLGADPSVADDVAQDALLAAFQQISEFRGDGSFQSWVKRIAARLYLKRVRRTAQFALTGEDEAAQIGDPASPSAARIAHRIDLDSALGELPISERLCVCLTYGAGLSHSETAAALNAPIGTVKSHVKRGLDRLRRRLANDVASAEDGATHG